MRGLDWDGYRNVRDLGGLPTPSSPTGATQLGRIARGPRRELLTDRGWQDARVWGLRSVVDLRCADEVGRREGDPLVAPDALTDITVVAAPTEDQDARTHMEDRWRSTPNRPGECSEQPARRRRCLSAAPGPRHRTRKDRP